MSYVWVATAESWEFFLTHLDPGDPPVLGIDTEFIRQYRYWPTLCLIQISDAKRFWLLDPFSEALDVRLWELLQSTHILKVMHGGSQDLCALYGWAFSRGYTSQHRFDGLTHFFDTQYAAWFFHMGRDISYKTLVSQWFETCLPQEARCSDWTQRPLDHEQILYAQEDIRYLRSMHAGFQALRQERGVLYFEEAMQTYVQKLWHTWHPTQAWKKFRHQKSHWTSSMRKALGPLILWREWLAHHLNQTRTQIVSNQTLVLWSALDPDTRAQHLLNWRQAYETSAHRPKDSVKDDICAPVDGKQKRRSLEPSPMCAWAFSMYQDALSQPTEAFIDPKHKKYRRKKSKSMASNKTEFLA